jgi:hypothetical protein
MYTRCEIQSRQFLGVGNVHFSDKEYLLRLFKKHQFQIIVLEHKENKMLIGGEFSNNGSLNENVQKNKPLSYFRDSV